MTYRKHPVAYLTPVAVIAILLGAYILIDADPVLVVVAVILIPIAVYNVLVARSALLTVDATGVRYSAGVLPWRKFSCQWTPDQIFSVRSDERGVLRWMFGYGTVSIVGKEGTTREVSIARMSQPRDCAAAINAILPRA